MHIYLHIRFSNLQFAKMNLNNPIKVNILDPYFLEAKCPRGKYPRKD